jgi:hypothetical protein
MSAPVPPIRIAAALVLRTNKADRIPSAAASRHMMNIYPPTLQQWINEHGGLTPNMIYLKGNELAAIVPKC